MKVLMIGAGTVGFPFGTILSNHGNIVHFVDTNLDRIKSLQELKDENIEEKGLLALYLKNKSRIKFIQPSELDLYYDVVVFAANIGVKSEEAVNLYLQYEAICKISRLVLFRSTINKQQWDSLSKIVDLDKFAYTPERSRPGNIVEEIYELPQFIGYESKIALSNTYEFLGSIVKECIDVSVPEAIAIKLLSNTWRASIFNLANKFFLDCIQMGVSFEKISSLAKKDYPRLNSLPLNGFISGPCLPKDYQSWKSWGKEEVIVDDLNEDLLQSFVASLVCNYPSLQSKKIALFGVTYREDLDDERGAFSLKVKNILENIGAEVKGFSSNQLDEVLEWDPYLLVNMFPRMKEIRPLQQFDFWSR